MRVPEGDLHCECELSIFPIVFVWALYRLLDFTERDLYWSIQTFNFPSKLAPILCKETCICKYQPVSDQLIKKLSKMSEISKNISLFPYITTSSHS